MCKQRAQTRWFPRSALGHSSLALMSCMFAASPEMLLPRRRQGRMGPGPVTLAPRPALSSPIEAYLQRLLLTLLTTIKNA